MEQLSDEEIDHGAEEDSDKEDQDLDTMFGAWLGELDRLTQVRRGLDGSGRPEVISVLRVAPGIRRWIQIILLAIKGKCPKH